MSRTDPRVIKTLRNIDNALLDNLDSHEFRKITVDMLCRTAMINRSTFYKYYTDKYELLDSFLNRVLNEFSQATATTDFILASPHTITNQEYVDNFRNTIDYIYEHRQIYRVLWRSSIDRPIYQEMEDIICRNILNTIREDPSGPRQTTPYHDLYAKLFSSNLMTLVRWWLSNESLIKRSDVETIMYDNMKNGLFSTFRYRN
ncbi:MAG: TetR/AcrR family transcriptional regulator [Lachnospiraceae bacterium]|nr:TetR/AcrR family transcriptional regulator [Lachnospiraceae bacterium]